jgi:hypothetical protein
MISGIGRALLTQLNPTFVWDPFRNRAAGKGIEGNGNFKFDTIDADAITNTEAFSVWDAGNERFKVVTPAGNPEEVFGTAGYFSDGYVEQRWTATWNATNLAFAVVTPTPSGSLYQETGVTADIMVGTPMGDVTVIDTDVDANAAVIEKSCTNSTVTARIFQILVKSEDGTSPVGVVTVGANLTAGTRTSNAGTWCRKLPGTRGWWAVMLEAPMVTPVYLSLNITAGTGRWFVACPMFYYQWSTFENIPRAPIPIDSGPTTYSRGLWYLKSTNAEISIKPSGWLAMSVVLPDPSVSRGHLDYAGAGSYKVAYLLNVDSEFQRIRVSMSESNDRLVVILCETTPTYYAYLDCASDWDGFAAMGIVVCWEINNGSRYASLYVNGRKLDSVANPATGWFPQGIAPAQLCIGTDSTTGEGVTAADCYISKVAMGKNVLQRKDARVLSSYMKKIARGQI